MSRSRLVYSTDGGRAPDQPPRQAPGGRRGPDATRGRATLPPPDDGVVRIFRERGGRGGKTVTVIRGLADQGPVLEARVSELKRLCGAGGTVREGAIEIQGDHRERIAARLREAGLRVKLAGG
jgi:translation initiation factor 1